MDGREQAAVQYYDPRTRAKHLDAVDRIQILHGWYLDELDDLLMLERTELLLAHCVFVYPGCRIT
jgi:hypothetical protein